MTFKVFKLVGFHIESVLIFFIYLTANIIIIMKFFNQSTSEYHFIILPISDVNFKFQKCIFRKDKRKIGLDREKTNKAQ